jgi:proline iminopeptidase
LASRGWPDDKVQLCRRWFNGEIESRKMFRTLMTLGPAYYHKPGLPTLVRDVLSGSWRTKLRTGGAYLRRAASGPGLVGARSARRDRGSDPLIAGASDFVFPPEAQIELSAGIPDARLALIDGAGHEPWAERRDVFFPALRQFLRTAVRGVAAAGAGKNPGSGRQQAAQVESRGWLVYEPPLR